MTHCFSILHVQRCLSISRRLAGPSVSTTRVVSTQTSETFAAHGCQCSLHTSSRQMQILLSSRSPSSAAHHRSITHGRQLKVPCCAIQETTRPSASPLPALILKAFGSLVLAASRELARAPDFFRTSVCDPTWSRNRSCGAAMVPDAYLIGMGDGHRLA